MVSVWAYSDENWKFNFYSFPRSGLEMQYWKLLLPVSQSWSFPIEFPSWSLGTSGIGKMTPT